MGKGAKKGGGRRRKKANVFGVGKVKESVGSAYTDTDRVTINTDSIDYVYDDVDQFNQKLEEDSIKKAIGSMNHKKAKKENVMTLGLDSSDEEGGQEEEQESVSSDSGEERDSSEEEGLKPFLEDGDFIPTREDKLIDERAWGKDKRDFYGTNVSDQIIRKRAHRQHINAMHQAASLELQAHREYKEKLEERLASVDDMELLSWGEHLTAPTEENSTTSAKTQSKKQNKKKVAADVKKRVTKFVESENPEYYPLIDDMIAKLKECREILEPILEAEAYNKLGACKSIEYVKLRYITLSNYCLNVSAYGMLFCSGGREKIVNHPVMKNIAMYHKLFKLSAPLDKVMAAQLIELVKRLEEGCELNLLHPPVKTQSSVNTFSNEKIRNSKKLSILKKKIELDGEKMDSDSDETDDEATGKADPGAVDDDTRRHIGKVISANRGLTVRRKKEDKNPRMKYKRKYANKLKKRKGQIRDVMKENSLYAGETSGINAYVIKSRKIK